jgi:hypothetical protein
VCALLSSLELVTFDGHVVELWSLATVSLDFCSLRLSVSLSALSLEHS